MIAKLRRRHRLLVTALFVAVAALYFWGIMARRAMPRVAHPPGQEKLVGHEEVVP